MEEGLWRSWREFARCRFVRVCRFQTMGALVMSLEGFREVGIAFVRRAVFPAPLGPIIRNVGRDVDFCWR